MGASGSIGVVERAALEADIAVFCEQKPKGRERVLSYDTAWYVESVHITILHTVASSLQLTGDSEVLSHLGEVQVETQCSHCGKQVGALNLKVVLEEARERGFSLEDQPFLYDSSAFCNLTCFFQAHKRKPCLCQYVDSLFSMLDKVIEASASGQSDAAASHK